MSLFGTGLIEAQVQAQRAEFELQRARMRYESQQGINALGLYASGRLGAQQALVATSHDLLKAYSRGRDIAQGIVKKPKRFIDELQQEIDEWLTDVF